jgi:hypothetical protein
MKDIRKIEDEIDNIFKAIEELNSKDYRLHKRRL